MKNCFYEKRNFDIKDFSHQYRRNNGDNFFPRFFVGENWAFHKQTQKFFKRRKKASKNDLLE